MGKLEAKAMHDAGYPQDLSASLTAVSALLGLLVPPSIPMVIYGVISGASIGGLFLGGIIPGPSCTIAMMVMLYIVAGRRSLPVERRTPAREVARLFVLFLCPRCSPRLSSLVASSAACFRPPKPPP